MSDAALSLEITRKFDAPPERVFDAWLSKSWGEWAGPRGMQGEVTLMEPKVGGRYRLVMHAPDGRSPAVSGVYREVVRPQRLVFTWKWEHGNDETLVTLVFKAAGKGTELTVRHEGFTTAQDRDDHEKGWNGTCDRLAAVLR